MLGQAFVSNPIEIYIFCAVSFAVLRSLHGAAPVEEAVVNAVSGQRMLDGASGAPELLHTIKHYSFRVVLHTMS